MGFEINGKRVGRTMGAMRGVVVRGGDGKPDRIVESHILKEDGTKEVEFMAEERKEELSKMKQFGNYLKQFHKVEGIETQTYLKNNKFIIAEEKDQEISSLN